MANIFKTLTSDDVANSKTLLHELIPLTGTIVSGTYKEGIVETNILNYSHGMFQTVFDYPYLSSSANNLFDITFGTSKDGYLYGQSSTVEKTKKVNVYNQLAKVLYGYDATGSILSFDKDGNAATSDDYLPEGFFISFSRLLVKDEIKKGSFSLKLGLGSNNSTPFSLTGTVTDLEGASSPPQYLVNSPAGDYGKLFLKEPYEGTPPSGYNNSQTNNVVGLIFYQAGIVFLSTGLFGTYSNTNPKTAINGNSNGQLTAACAFSNSFTNIQLLAKDATIQQIADNLRSRIFDIKFQNTTELNSSIYFLRINNNEFNYSSNPTYLSNSEIIVKGGKRENSPISYITTAGLYSPDNELLAVAKLSQPLKKTEEQSMILRVRLDY